MAYYLKKAAHDEKPCLGFTIRGEVNMGFSSASYMLQEAYHKLQRSTAEKEKIMEKLEAASITPPSEEKFNTFCNIYTSYHDKVMQSYEVRTANVLKFLNSQLARIEAVRQEILKEIHDDKQRIEQAEFNQEEHLRALKLEENEIQHYKQMREKLEHEYQAWKAQQEEVRKEREKLLAVIHNALNELFSELLQTNLTHDFLFDGKHGISINFSDVYREIEDITRDYFNLVLHEEDYIEKRTSIIKQIVTDEIDAIIHQRPHAEYARLWALKDQAVISETHKLVRSIDLDMRERSAYDRIEEANKSLNDNFGVTYVKQVKKEVSKVKEVVSEEKEMVSEKKEVISEEKEVVSEAKKIISEEKRETSQKEEQINKTEKDINEEKEKASLIQVEVKEEKSKPVIESLEQKKKEKSSETQIIHAFLETQMSRKETYSQARNQHMKDITDILKGLQAEEKKSPDAKIEAIKTDAAKILPQKSLFPLISTSSISKAPPQNDSTFSGEPQQASTAPARRRRF